jgi:DNA-binding IclR family transcriptional regulator
MAQINIVTTAEEQDKVLAVLRQLNGATAPVSQIAKHAKLNPNRVRYIIADLCDAGKVAKVPTKAINKHYIRYSYEVRV